MLDTDVLIRLKVSMAGFAQSLMKMAVAMRGFVLNFLSAVERPEVLRAFSKGVPKKDRRRIGRKIRRLERAQTV